MEALIAALHWAVDEMEWLDSVPKIKKPKTSTLRQAKGRSLATEEFERMIDKTPAVVGESAAESWIHVLRGLWTSALRLEEIMHVSWDDANFILPVWPKRRRPVLQIPADMQKNDTEEAIPLLPDFESLLLETPLDDHLGWVFRPKSLQGMLGREARHGRPNAEWVGKIISRIGKAAGVVVSPANKRTGKPAKYASIHDLRRSCGERLLDAGVPQDVFQRVMHHASWETTKRFYAVSSVQKDAEKLWNSLQKEQPVEEAYLGT